MFIVKYIVFKCESNYLLPLLFHFSILISSYCKLDVKDILDIMKQIKS